MNCPVDDEVLQMSERSGVEVDYCPRCRGVWLDRGELDKILERAEREFRPVGGDRSDDFDRPEERWGGGDRGPDRGPGDGWNDRSRGQGRPKKRKNFLSEMLEFGDD